jgi:hypothetical protein
MTCGFTCWAKSLFLMALLFGALGGMTSWGYFFFENREMCPCAPVGLENGDALSAAVAQPYSDELMVNRVLSFGGVGALIGIAIGIAVVAPRASRLKELEESEEL